MPPPPVGPRGPSTRCPDGGCVRIRMCQTLRRDHQQAGSTRGVRSSTSQQHDASKSAVATGAARLNHASSTLWTVALRQRARLAPVHHLPPLRRETFTRPGPLLVTRQIRPTPDR